VIYLWTDGKGWKPHEPNETKEFAKRGITIGKNITIGEGVRIGDNAQLGDSAHIGDDVQIGYSTWVNNNVRIADSTWIGDNVSIDEDTQIGNGVWIGVSTRIGDKVRIGSGTHIGDNALIVGGAQIGDDAHINDSAIPNTVYIVGSRFRVSYWGEDRIDIGCLRHSIRLWREHGREIAEENNFTPEQIAEYDTYLTMIETIHNSSPKTIGSTHLGKGE
jgi:UDP-3-O-[3-hydroxymyristoyl] glucosamine N-acyltransferase